MDFARMLNPDKRKGHPGTGQPFPLGRIVPTEGYALTVKTFLGENLMSVEDGVSSEFYRLTTFIIN